jgi:lipoyl(octanoyl) transferase
MSSAIDVRDAGIVDYAAAVAQQTDLQARRAEERIPDTIIVLEHPHVVTLGRLTQPSGIMDNDFFAGRGIPVVRSPRGGEITYHAPGQLLMYPVIRLDARKKAISNYIDLLEKMTVRALGLMGVQASRIDGRRGVWVGGRKIAFTGISVKRWVTAHGVAINVNNDISPFTHMHPCGEKDIIVTSVREVLGVEMDMAEVKKVFADQFSLGIEREFVGRAAREEAVGGGIR